MKRLNEYPTPETDRHTGLRHDMHLLIKTSRIMEQRTASCRDLLACINSSQCLSEELHAEIRETLAETK